MSVQGATRRLLGIALTWMAASVGLFWGSATYAARAATVKNPFSALPLFFNRHPTSVRELAAAAMREVARGGVRAAPAAAELARLGGAALPYVLPALDSLDPDSRVRVALALTPVAERMEVATAEELVSGDQAVLFWTRFWQDRSIDFRAPAVRHLTTRMAERSIALRREDLIHVDTFALGALIEALGEASSTEDVARVQRLNSVLTHVTNQNVPLPTDANTAQAQRTIETWRDFWQLHEGEYSALDGPRRLTATFAETQYGKWLGDVLRGGLGRTRLGEPALALLERSLPTTGFLLLIGLGGGFSLAVAWTRFERTVTRLTTRYASALLGTTLAAIPCATFVHLLSGSGAGTVSAAVLVTLTTAAWVSRHIARSTLSSSRPSAISAAFSVSAPIGATYPPIVLSAIVLVELAFELPGLGRAAALSLRTGDANAWMATSLTLALATLLLRQAADLIRRRTTRAPTESRS